MGVILSEGRGNDNDPAAARRGETVTVVGRRPVSFPGFPPGLPPLPADAPHNLSVEQRENLAQAAVAGRSEATRAADLHEARWAVDAIDAAFARAARGRRTRHARTGKAAA
jgi:hypothetical protein